MSMYVYFTTKSKLNGFESDSGLFMNRSDMVKWRNLFLMYFT